MAVNRKKLVGLGIVLLVAVGAVFGVRQAVAQVYVVSASSIEPELPQGSRVLVFKLGDAFEPGDIVAFHHSSGETHLGRFESIDATTQTLIVSRNSVGTIEVAERDVIGRVVLSTR